MRSRSLHTLVLAGGIAMIAVVGLRAASGSSPDVTVHLFQFRPGQTEVARGTTIRWTNQDDITHTITSGTPEKRDGRFDTPLAAKGATASVTFKDPGVYPYFCDRHQSMRGEI